MDKEVKQILDQERERQQKTLSLIPSENHPSQDVVDTVGGVFTGKYAEGYPGKRYYGGNTNADQIENLARERAKKIFRADHANVQPLSGSAMNMAVYLGLLNTGDTILAMDLSHGGHLSHGSPVSHTSKLFNFVWYKTNPETGEIDYEELSRLAQEHKPKLVVCGYTSYPLDYDYEKFKKVADEAGAYTYADVSHIAGFIAGGVMKNPFDFGFDVVGTTTHKSLRGPRAGLILCKSELAEKIDKSVFPGLQGGPHMDNVAALAVALGEAETSEFKDYASQTLKNAKVLAEELKNAGVILITGRTENHMVVIDTVKSFGIDGKEAEERLESLGIIVNKQIIPDDPNPPMKPSGIRLGTPAVTTRGLKEDEIKELAEYIFNVLNYSEGNKSHSLIKEKVSELCDKFVISN